MVECNSVVLEGDTGMPSQSSMESLQLGPLPLFLTTPAGQNIAKVFSVPYMQTKIFLWKSCHLPGSIDLRKMATALSRKVLLFQR